jgi:phage terminase large subunit-like protein
MKSRSVVLPDGVVVPRIRHVPRVRANAWEDVVELSTSYGLELLAWQENVLEAAMGERSDGLWAAKHVGLSCPRQNGKGSLLEARALAGLMLFDEQMIIHSAHEVRTAQIGFQRLKSYFENYDDLRRKVVGIGNAVAREYIRLRSGQEVRFVTRSKSAIRGFSADCLLLDEGQILGDQQWEAILYTVSARPNHQIWLVGTPPVSLEEGVVFDRFRTRGIDGKDHRLAWLEWSAEPGSDLDDPAGWAQANPALGELISHETVVTERAAASDEGFARERLGMWGAGDLSPVFDLVRWLSLANRDAPPPAKACVVVDVSPDCAWSTIGVAGAVEGKTLVMCHSGQGTSWVAPKVAELVAGGQVVEVALFTFGQARSLQPDLVKAGVEFEKLSQIDMAAAASAMRQAVTDGAITHVGQTQLDAAVAGVRTRRAGEQDVFDRRDGGVDISPLVAVSGALWRWGLLKPAKAPQIHAWPEDLLEEMTT